MKLPVYLASEPVGVAREPQADPRMFAAGGSGMEALGKTLAHVSDISMRVAQAEDKAQDALARSQAGEAHSALLLGLKTAETDLSAVQEPNAIFPAYKEAVDAVQNTVRSRLSPRALKHYDEKASGILAESAARVYALRNKRFESGINAATDAELQNQSTLAGLSSLEDGGTEFKQAQERAFSAIDGNAAWSAEKKQEKRAAWLAANTDAYATRFAAEQPDLFLEEAGRPDAGIFRDMPAKRRTELQISARSKIRDQLAKAEQALVETRKNWRESVQRETAIHLENRTLTEAWMGEYKYAFTDTEHRAYRKALEEQKYGGPPGDPAVMDALRTAAYRSDVNPKETQARLFAARAANLVNNATWSTLSTHLDARIKQTDDTRRSEQDKGEQKVERLVDKRHAMAERLLGLAFATTGKLLSFDQTSEEVHTQMLERLARESQSTGGKRDPMDIYRQAIVDGVPMVISRATARRQVIENRLGQYRTKEALKAAAGTMSEGVFFELGRLLEEYDGIGKELLRLDAVRKGATGTGTNAATEPQKPAKSNPRER